MHLFLQNLSTRFAFSKSKGEDWLTRMIHWCQFPRSVTILGDLLDFWQLFKAYGNINLPKSLTFLGNFCQGVKIYNFSHEIIFGQPS